MESPNLYKKISTVDVSNKNISKVSAAELTEVNTTLAKFVTLFKEAHL